MWLLHQLFVLLQKLVQNFWFSILLKKKIKIKKRKNLNIRAEILS